MLDTGLRFAFAFGPTGVAAVVGIVIAVTKRRSEPVVARLAGIGLALLLVSTIVATVQIAVNVEGWTVDEVRTFFTGTAIVVLVLTTIAWVLLLTSLFVRLPERAAAPAAETEDAPEADGAPTGRHVLLDDAGQPVVAETGQILAGPRTSPGFPASGAGLAGAAGAGVAGAAFGTGVFGEPRSQDGPPADAVSPEAGTDTGEESPTQALPVVTPDAASTTDEDGSPDPGADTGAEDDAGAEDGAPTDGTADPTGSERSAASEEASATTEAGAPETRAFAVPASVARSTASDEPPPGSGTAATRPQAPADDEPDDVADDVADDGAAADEARGDDRTEEADDGAGADDGGGADDGAAADDEVPATGVTPTSVVADPVTADPVTADPDIADPDIADPATTGSTASGSTASGSDPGDPATTAPTADRDEAGSTPTPPTADHADHADHADSGSAGDRAEHEAVTAQEPGRRARSAHSGPLPTRTPGAPLRLPAPFAAPTRATPDRASQDPSPTTPERPPPSPRPAAPPAPAPRAPSARPSSEPHPWFTPTGDDDPRTDGEGTAAADTGADGRSTRTGG